MILNLSLLPLLVSGDLPWASSSPLREPAIFAPGRISTGGYESHAELLAQGGIYARLHALQFSEEETAGAV